MDIEAQETVHFRTERKALLIYLHDRLLVLSGPATIGWLRTSQDDVVVRARLLTIKILMK